MIKLNPLQKLIVSVLANESATGYDITKKIQGAWPCSHQQVYRDLLKMKEVGMVDFEDVPQTGKPDKTIYTLFPLGLDAAMSSMTDDVDVVKYGSTPLIAHMAMMVGVGENTFLLDRHVDFIDNYGSKISDLILNLENEISEIKISHSNSRMDEIGVIRRTLAIKSFEAELNAIAQFKKKFLKELS